MHKKTGAWLFRHLQPLLACFIPFGGSPRGMFFIGRLEKWKVAYDFIQRTRAATSGTASAGASNGDKLAILKGEFILYGTYDENG